MNIRACAFSIAVAFAAVSSPAPVAHAQGAAKDDPFVEMARQRFQEGVKLYDQKKYPEARAAFMQAYALKKHPAVLLNLAQSELRSGHPVEAARHFSQYLQENKEAKPLEKKAAEQGLTEARAKTGRLQVEVNLPGADVLVDDELVGRSPLPDMVDVEPGARKIEARLAGYPSAVANVTAAIGQASPVSLKLDKGGSTAAVAAPVPAPPTSEPVPAPVTAPTPAPAETSQPADQGVSVSTEGRPNFFKWAAKDKVAWATAGVGVVGLGLGLVFSIQASRASSNADNIAGQIRAVASGDGDLLNYGGANRQGNPCAAPVPVTTSTNYAPACNQLKDNMDASDTDKTVAYLGWGLFGAGAAATVVAYFLRTKPEKKTASAEPLPRTTAFAPVLAPGLHGVALGGTF